MRIAQAAVAQLFDMHQRALRRDRAARRGGDLFLLQRAFEDTLERLEAVHRPFARAALIGCPDPDWVERLRQIATTVHTYDPGPLFARRASGAVLQEDGWQGGRERFDLIVAIGTLDTVNDLPLALRIIGHAMEPDALLIGAVAGGHSFPALRAAMRAADAGTGTAMPHVHPRIEAAALAPLLSNAGFSNPVVDVDRVQLRYGSLDRLIGDLRDMAGTNILSARPRLARASWESAQAAFQDLAIDGKTTEVVEIIHFAAWTAKQG